VSIATDMKEGIVDRFRSLPMSRAAHLVGHVIAEFAASVLAIAILLGAGLIVGWRIHTDAPHALGGLGLLLLFSLTMIWIGTLVGLLVRTADAVQGVAFILVFPLTFVANTFVPAGGLPDGLRQIAEWNPISALAAGIRQLFGNPTAVPHHAMWPLQHPVLAAFGWCLLLIVVAVPLTLRRYRVRTTD
jgi:ABC-type multidrug transport system permease subunit